MKYFLPIIKNDTLVWQARAQVGKNQRQSPVFKDDLKYLVFNPTWTVPPMILKKDVFPAVKKDINYLKRKKMTVITQSGKVIDPTSIDWGQYPAKGFPYRIRQEPGPSNALGRVKFIFPNKHYVYLHDTPSKALFERKTCTFSSGCIRVEEPFRLAEALLKDKKGLSYNNILKIIDSKKTKTIYLDKSVPVYLHYATAFPGMEDDSIQFREDVYNRDPVILKNIKGGFKKKIRRPGSS